MLIHVPLDRIDDNPFQRRQDYGDVQALAADIQQRGLLQVPRGRLTFDGQPQDSIQTARLLDSAGGGFPAAAACRVQIAFGHRRLRAFRHLADTIGGRWAAMPVYVEALSDDDMLNAVWSENQHRSDINPIEQAELLAEKLERVRAAGGNQATVAAEWGLDRSTIANKLRLLDLPEHVRAAVRARQLSERQATALLPVVDLAQRLNGTTVEWRKGEKYEPYSSPPIAPAAFITHALAHAATVTSDTIRMYTQSALGHTGRVLPDDIAKFDAGEVEGSAPVIQPLCAGCRYRFNQHCLNRPCLAAKTNRFKQRIPTLAAAHTGLPWSDGDLQVIVPTDRDEARALRDAYRDGRHGGLLVTWLPQGWHESWFDGGPSGWRSTDEIANDWRKGLLIGRHPDAFAANDLPIVRPPRQEWTALRARYRELRKTRVRTAFADAIAPLAQQPEALRALSYLLFAHSSPGAMGGSDPADLAHRLAEHAYRYLYTSDRDELRRALEAAGLPPTAAEPADAIERLTELAAEALENWYNYRDAAQNRRASAAAAVRRVYNHFTDKGITADAPTQPDELRELARWLALALDDVGAVMSATPEAA